MTDAETMHARLNALRLAIDADALETVCDEIEHRPDGARFVPDLLAIMEENPDFDFGVPGVIVHVIEKFRGHYEEHLLASLRRKPTGHTAWMLNRIINATDEDEKTTFVVRMLTIALAEGVDAGARDSARSFLEYQIGMPWDEIEADARSSGLSS